MKIIGLDFGTTNSTISYYSEESKALTGFQVSASAIDYIPTVVAYNKSKNNEISIGDAAKANLTAKNFEVYEYFKLRLGKDSNTPIEGKIKTPVEVTRDFIKNLLDVYKSSQHIDAIEGIVMTVPETWFREASNRTTRENIEKIFEELGYQESEILLESEPVAAAAYFCRAYEDNRDSGRAGTKYNGFITVIDYGGGTLDVTLCEVVNGKEIRVLERCGFGEYNDTNGCAGVAFDEAVIEKLVGDNKLSFPKNSSKFIKLRDSFEKKKITLYTNITKYLKFYYDDPAIVEDEVLFSLEYNDGDDTLDVHCEDLDECFNRVNAPKLRASLEQVKQFFNAHNIDSSSQDNFKVLLVGGFSNFFAVEKEVRSFFNASVEDIDKRFVQLPVKNRASAISRGAALIAKEEIIPVHTCTHSYGYIVGSLGESDRWVDNYIPVVAKGTDIKELGKPVFKEDGQPLRVLRKGNHLRIFIDDGRPNNAGRLPAALDESVSELFPNIDEPGNGYRIGFSVSRNQIPTIHIKDKHGKIISTSLNKLIERIAIIQ